MASPAPPAAKNAGEIPLTLASGDLLPFVVLLFAARQRNLHLRPPSRQVNARWNEGQALLAHIVEQAGDLATVEQQPPRATRLVVHPVGGLVRSDVGVDQPDLTPVVLHVRLSQADLSGANRLDLAALQSHAGLDAVFEKEVMLRLAVRGDDLYRLVAHGAPPSCSSSQAIAPAANGAPG